MGAFGFASTAILMALNILGASILRQSKAVILIGVILTLVALAMTAIDYKKSWASVTILYALALGNSAWLLATTGISLSVAAMMLIDMIGLVIALLATDTVSTTPAEKVTLETYSKDNKKKQRGRPKRRK